MVIGEHSTMAQTSFLRRRPPHSLVIPEEANVKVMSKRDRERSSGASDFIFRQDEQD
jgi:hypothetical protein